MFERFTDRARRVLVSAQQEAKRLGHPFIGTEHILLGLIVEEDGLAAKALRELGIDLDQTRRKVEAAVGPVEASDATGPPPFTPRSKKVLELSLREALNLGHNYIGTEHLLLGLVREGEGIGPQVLIEQGLSAPKVRNKVVSLLAGYGASREPSPVAKTPAGARVEAAAVLLAQGAPVGSQHYLLALLEDARSLAGQVLASFGVTTDAVADRIASIGVAGTEDEVPPPFSAQVVSGGVTIRIEDPGIAARVQAGELVVTFRPAGETPAAAEPQDPQHPQDPQDPQDRRRGDGEGESPQAT
jgi:ATP-dependent Clp protease ATP-binding subunit ClpA